MAETIKVHDIGKSRYISYGKIDPRFFVAERAQRILVQPMGMELKNMVTAHPRSCTRWMSKYLRACGLKMPHEEPGEDGIVSWQHITEGKHRVKCDNIIHLVRHPINVISSAIHILHPSAYPFMFESIGNPDIGNRIAWSMYTYIHWNRLIEKRAIYRIRFDDLRLKYRELLEILKAPEIKIPPLGLLVNNAPHPMLGVCELRGASEELFKQLQELSLKYGYVI